MGGLVDPGGGGHIGPNPLSIIKQVILQFLENGAFAWNLRSMEMSEFCQHSTAPDFEERL